MTEIAPASWSAPVLWSFASAPGHAKSVSVAEVQNTACAGPPAEFHGAFWETDFRNPCSS